MSLYAYSTRALVRYLADGSIVPVTDAEADLPERLLSLSQRLRLLTRGCHAGCGWLVTEQWDIGLLVVIETSWSVAAVGIARDHDEFRDLVSEALGLACRERFANR